MKKIKKFVNDGDVYYKKAHKKDAVQAAEVWGEGFDPLIALLETCIKNGITTMACCAGHLSDGVIHDMPYIYFEDQHGITDYLLERMVKEPSLYSVVIGRNFINNNPSVSFHSYYQYRREFFTNMLGYVQDYVHTNGPVTPTSINNFIKVLKSKRKPEENPDEKSTLRKILDIMRNTDLQRMISYTAHTNVYNILSYRGVPSTSCLEENVEEYLLDIVDQETEMPKSNVMQTVKGICRNASTGINEIQEVARKLQGKMQTHNPNIQEEKQDLEK